MGRLLSSQLTLQTLSLFSENAWLFDLQDTIIYVSVLTDSSFEDNTCTHWSLNRQQVAENPLLWISIISDLGASNGVHIDSFSHFISTRDITMEWLLSLDHILNSLRVVQLEDALS